MIELKSYIPAHVEHPAIGTTGELVAKHVTEMKLTMKSPENVLFISQMNISEHVILFTTQKYITI